MLTNPASAGVRALVKLTKRKYRGAEGRFIAEGPQAVFEALKSAPGAVERVLVTPQLVGEHPQFSDAATAAGLELEYASAEVIAKLSTTVTPQGVVAVVAKTLVSVEAVFEQAPTLVAILHEVRDPGNLGTIIRVADAVGARAVVLTGDSVDVYNPKVVRATTGSLFHLDIALCHELERAALLARQAGLAVVAADVGGETLESTTARWLAEPTAWLFGNEAHGLSASELAVADRVVRLPILGQAESLNLAMAATVSLYASAFARLGAATA